MSNVTDPDSAKMAISKEVIQGYSAQAAVESAHQVIVLADVIGSGSRQQCPLPTVVATEEVRAADTMIIADAGYHANEDLQILRDRQISALVVDSEIRKRDERFKDQGRYKAKPDPLSNKGSSPHSKKLFQPLDFRHEPKANSCVCPTGERLYSSGSNRRVDGLIHHKFKGAKSRCVPCKMRRQRLRRPQRTQIRQVAIFAKHQPSRNGTTEIVNRAIDSERGRRMYSQRNGTVEPVFANLRHDKRLSRFTLRGQCKVRTQYQLYSLVHNIEKMLGGAHDQAARRRSAAYDGQINEIV